VLNNRFEAIPFSASLKPLSVLQLCIAIHILIRPFVRRIVAYRSAVLLSTVAGVNVQAANQLANTSSRALRKQLGFLDLVFACVLMVVIPDFFGTAVKAGSASVLFWLLALAFFFIPQAFIVSHLNQKLPLEGGLYEWARAAFGNVAGFLVAWNLWLYVVLYAAAVGLVTMNYLSYILGPNHAWVATDRRALFVATIAIVAGLTLVTHFGLQIGKWITNVGSFVTIVTIAVMALLPFIRHAQGTLAEYHPLKLTLPPMSLFSFSVFSKMTFGALCGLEYAMIFSGESRNPLRHFPRAVLCAVPIIAMLYIFGTSAILAFVPPDSIDLIGPIPQALQLGFAGMAAARIIVPVTILLLFTNYLASFSFNFAANTRLPMVAGWDQLLPAWFTRLHPKYRTPVNSILFLGTITLFVALATILGVRELEAFSMLQVWGFTFYGLAYLALFAIPILAKQDSQLRGSLALRVVAASGFVLTLLFVVLSVFPIIDVAHPLRYAAKTIAVLLGANIFALALFFLQSRTRKLSA
jgi:glutamate:GABA antiporter